MGTETASLQQTPWSMLARCAAIVWVVGLTMVYLFGYGAWLLPLQLVETLAATAGSLSIGPHFAGFVTGRLADAGCVCAILATAFAAGATATARWISRRDLMGALMALAVGLWIVATAVLVIGAVSVRSVPWVFVGLAFWLSPAPRSYFRGAYDSAGSFDLWSKWMVIFVIVAGVMMLPGVLAPPFEYDELEYHLGGPSEYIRSGRILFLPYNFYSNLPQLTEMLYLLTMVTSSDIAAKLLHWLFGVLAALGVYAVAARLWGRNTACVAMAMFYCSTFVQHLSQTARVDLATTSFAVLAFGGLLVWRRGNETGRGEDAAPTGDKHWLWLSALMAGAAVATKWTAIPVVWLPALVFVVVSSRSLKLPTVYCLLSTTCILPWLVKNCLLTGNPVYPLFYNVFPSTHWSTEQVALFAQKHYPPPLSWSGLTELFNLAWKYEFTEAHPGPLLLMLAPLVLFVSQGDRSARRAGGLFVGAYAGWFFFTFRPWRFLFPAVPMAAMIGAYALDRLGHERLVRVVLRIAVAVVLVVNLTALGLMDFVDGEEPDRIPPKMSFLHHTLGLVSTEDFVARMQRHTFEPVIWMNQHLPPTARVLYVGEARIHFAQSDVLWSTAFDQHPLTEMARTAKSADQLLTVLRERGVTHVYVNFPELRRLGKGYGYLRDMSLETVGSVLEKNAKKVYASSWAVVYELPPLDGGG